MLHLLPSSLRTTALLVLVSLLSAAPIQADDRAAGPTSQEKVAKALKDKDAAAKPSDQVVFPRKIVLIAGPKDEHHGPGTHDYEETVKTIAEALKASNVADKVVVEVVLNGWPQDSKILDDADTIFLVSAGADRNESEHPFLAEDRMKVLAKQMDRGCGLMMLHWSVFVPIKYEEQFTDWLGGFFDYQRGEDPRGWYSAITFAKPKILPNAKHEIGKGVPPFELRDEYYYRIRFAKNDKRITPIVTVELPEVEEPQVVAWAVNRKNGGRSFAFTGGHFQKSWDDDAYRMLLLNALCWTAKVPLPAGGVNKQLAFDDKWTPKPHLGKEDLPKESEADWVDGRIRETDVGPYYTTSIVVPDPTGAAPVRDEPVDDRKLPLNPNMVTKALAIKVGGQEGLPPATVLFDKERMSLRAAWTGGFLNFSDRRYGLLEKPTIDGKIEFLSDANSWQTVGGSSPAREWHGLSLSGDKVVLAYSVADREIKELTAFEPTSSGPVFSRTFEVAPAKTPLVATLAYRPGSRSADVGDAKSVASLVTGDQELLSALVTSAADAQLAADEQGRLLLSIPSSAETLRIKIVLRGGKTGEVEDYQAFLNSVAPPIDLAQYTDGGPRRWSETITTKGVLGTPEEGSPFAVDTITIPYENPYKALFFAGGFDFTPDGSCYLCTAHGDVWKIDGIDNDLDKVTWQRFATGLYEPLGLKVRDGEIFVLGRDQITRLHDKNGDGEADYYECFNDDLTDLGQAHAYAMCLETDAAGNFYFVKSGAPSTPHGGSLIKVSADGAKLEVFATGFRHTNGLSIGPDGTITAADNEGNWVPVTRIDFVEEGDFCGHIPTAHLDPEPEDYGVPLCWLPRVVDNSAGGQAWVPEGEWGPLAGQLLHLSFGQCTASLILKEQIDGVWQGGAVRLPTPRFLSGVCRGRFRTAGQGADNHLYVCGLDGWSSAAEREGCFQRVRYVGGPLLLPTAVHIFEDGIQLAFAEPVDADIANDSARYAVDIWNYRWSQDYGSSDYSVADPTQEGRDALKITSATTSADGRQVFLKVAGLQPVMQLRVQAGLKTTDGADLPVDYYGTIHRLRPPISSVSGG